MIDNAHMGAQEKWTGKGDFLGACLCNIFGMANVWRFPHLVYTNGGGAFLIPYIVCFITLGVPAMLLELTLGQYSSSGPVNCWGFCPLFSGCGISMTIISFLTGIYYAVLVAWAILFFMASVSFEEPWQKCGPWSSPNCSEQTVFLNQSECLVHNLTVNYNGLCSGPEDSNTTYIWSYEVAKNYGVAITFPANEYFDGAILGIRNHTIENLGEVQERIALTLLFTWALVWLFLIKGIHISAKMLIRTMLLPIVIFIALAVRGLVLEGSQEGIQRYIIPDPSKIRSLQVWDTATEHVLFTLTASYGGLIALARYNDFHHNIFRDIIIISCVNAMVSLAVGVMLFSFLGFIAKTRQMDINDVTESGPNMAFKIMPMALSELPGTSVWCAVFFLMLVFLSLGSQIIYVETVISSIIDLKPEYSRTKFLTISAVCSVMYLLGLPLTTQGGRDIINLLNMYCTGRNLYLITVCECIAVGWIYGSKVFLNDVEIMLGRKLSKTNIINKLLLLFFRLNWQLLTPGFLMLMIFIAHTKNDVHEDIKRYPLWSTTLGWAITGLLISIILIVAVYRLLTARGSLMKRLKTTTSPSGEWGPAVTSQRFVVKKYLPAKVASQMGSKHGSQNTSLDQTSVQTTTSVNYLGSESGFVEESTDTTGAR